LHFTGRSADPLAVRSVPTRRSSDLKVDTFTVTALDGTTKQISFTIHGANEAAVIGDPPVHDVTEDVNVVNGNLTASGTLPISDEIRSPPACPPAATQAHGNPSGRTL